MFGYSDDYYMEKIQAKDIVEKLEKDLKNNQLPKEKRTRKNLVLKTIKYYYAF